MSKRPVATSLIFCEKLVIEEGTRNATLINCFINRTSPSFPTEPIDFLMTAWLSDGEGELLLKVLLQSLDDLEILRVVEQRVRFAHPLDQYRCTIRLKGVIFPNEGKYQAMLLADDELIAERAVRVYLRK